MAQVSAGVVGQADISGGSNILGFPGSQDQSSQSPVFWSTFFFGLSVGFFLFIYFAGKR